MELQKATRDDVAQILLDMGTPSDTVENLRGKLTHAFLAKITSAVDFYNIILLLFRQSSRRPLIATTG